MRATKLDEVSGKEQASPSVMRQDSGVKHREGYVTDTSYRHKEAVTTPSRSRISEPSSSSPKGGRLHEIRASPTWRNASGFIKQSAGLGDDPFIAESATPKSPDDSELILSAHGCGYTYVILQVITDSNLALIGSTRGSAQTMLKLYCHQTPVSSWRSEYTVCCRELPLTLH